jgi:hypothetical protein
MLPGLPEQEPAGFGRVTVSPVRLVNSVSDISADVQPVIMPDPQMRQIKKSGDLREL